MRSRTLTPLIACAVVLLICRSAFTVSQSVDVNQQVLKATWFPEGIDRTLQFHGIPCIDDCNGHEAPYQWSGSHHVGDVYDCIGDTEPFWEGCRINVEQLPYTALTNEQTLREEVELLSERAYVHNRHVGR